MTWQPLETAPKDGTPIIACADYKGRSDLGAHPRTVQWGTYHPNAPGPEAWRNLYGHKEPYMTHWVPMPASPTEEEP